MQYLFFDTETTGLPFKDTGKNGHAYSNNGYPRPVQIAWKTVEPETGTIAEKVKYIYPVDFTMPEEVAQFNGITQSILLKKGTFESTVLDEFIADVKSSDAIVGHNVIFDITVLVGLLQDLNRIDDAALLINKPIRDTMTESTRWCAFPKVEGKRYDYEGEYKYPRLTELYNKLFGKDFDNAHDAMADVNATSTCFFELQARKIIP